MSEETHENQDDENEKKLELLHKFHLLQLHGITLPKNYNITMPYEELYYDYKLIINRFQYEQQYNQAKAHIRTLLIMSGTVTNEKDLEEKANVLTDIFLNNYK